MKKNKIKNRKLKDTVNDLAENALPTVISGVLDKHGRFGISLIFASMCGVLIANNLAPEFLDDITPLLEKYAIKEKK